MRNILITTRSADLFLLFIEFAIRIYFRSVNVNFIDLHFSSLLKFYDHVYGRDNVKGHDGDNRRNQHTCNPSLLRRHFCYLYMYIYISRRSVTK